MPVSDTAAPLAGQRRSTARLAAVQALYQMELSDSPTEDVIDEFLTLRIGREIEGEQYVDADRGHFKWLVRSVTERVTEIDECIGGALDAGWTIGRLGALMRVLLRSATVELLARPDIPARVVMNEYVELAGAFFSRREPAFVNAALDGIARRLRAGEFVSPDDSGGDVRSPAGR